MANPEHLRLLKEGYVTWNRWRRDGPGVVADFRGADLAGWDFACLHLEGADFTGANLRGAVFPAWYQSAPFDPIGDMVLASEGNRWRMRLCGADLRESVFEEAVVFHSDLSGADASGANFQRARLQECRLDGANLAGANFRGAEMESASLRQARVAGANFSGVSFFDVDREGVDLSGAQLREPFTGEPCIPVEWLGPPVEDMRLSTLQQQWEIIGMGELSQRRWHRRSSPEIPLSPPRLKGAALLEVIARRRRDKRRVRWQWAEFMAAAEPGDTLHYHNAGFEPGTCGFALARNGVPFAIYVTGLMNTAGT